MKRIERKYRNILVSFVVLAIVTALIFLLFYHDSTGLGPGFGLGVLLILISNFGLVIAGLATLIRFLRPIPTITTFAYSFIGTLNAYVGGYSLLVFLFGNMDSSRILYSLLNFVLGLFILVDTMSYAATRNKS